MWKPSSIRITDYSNNEFQLKVLKSIETYIDVTDCQAFKAKPLAKVAHLEDYIDEKPIDPSSRIPNKLPFDLSGRISPPVLGRFWGGGSLSFSLLCSSLGGKEQRGEGVI